MTASQALECMTTWPLEKRNKVEDSKIADPVKKYAEMEDETVKNVASKVRHNRLAKHIS